MLPALAPFPCGPSERPTSLYNALKTDLADLLGITKDALHIHLGLAIFALIIVIFRRSPGSVLPWLGVLAFELANELLDIFHWHEGAFSFEIGDAFKDVANTMFWPTVAMLAFRIVAARQNKKASPAG